MTLQVDLATETSSSTTITSVDSLAFVLEATVMINLQALEGSVLLSFGTGRIVRGSQFAVEPAEKLRSAKPARLREADVLKGLQSTSRNSGHRSAPSRIGYYTTIQ